MRRRRLLLAAGALALLAVVAAWTWLLVPRPGPGVTRANYERIREGMPLAEVEAIVGRKADYRLIEDGLGPSVSQLRLLHIWLEGGDFFEEGTTSLVVSFKPDFTVRDASFAKPPFSYRLRQLLPW
jgi:hypothetical protein